jgi:uncharacterized protein (TIGR02099 family)
VGALLGRLCFITLLLVTCYLSAGRWLLPQVAGESARIEAALSRVLQVPVRIEGLQGRWRGFAPWFDVAALTLQLPESAAQRIEHLSFGIDMGASLRQRRLVIASLAIGAVDLVVEQTPQGNWVLAGLPESEGDSSDLVKNILLNTPHLSLAESRLTVKPREGQALTLHEVFAEIENRGPVHRAQLQFLLEDQPAPSRLALELDGLPGTALSGHGWASLPDLDLQTLLQPSLPTWQVAAAGLSAELWFDFAATGAVSFTGRVRDAQLSAQEDTQKLRIPLSGAAVDLQGARQPNGTWELQLAGLDFTWDQRHWMVPSLQLRQNDLDAPTVWVEAARVDLDMLATLALTAAPLPPEGANALRTLAPQGVLRNLHLQTRSDGSYPGFFQLRANLDDGAVEAWNNAPAGKHLFAYVEANALSGVAEVDSRDVTLQLPHLFSDAWHYESVNGRVTWQVADGEVRVQSDLLDVHSAEIDARVGFSVLDRPLGTAEREHSFKLMVGVDRMAVVPGKVYLPTLPNQPRLTSTLDWLRQALEGGELDSSGFMLRLQRRSGAEVSTSVQSWYQVNAGRLRYLKEWAPLDNLVAGVSVRDDAVDVAARSGSIDGVALGAVTAEVRPEEAGGAWLSIAGAAATDTASGHRFLLRSPLHALIGPTFDTWKAAGQLAISLNLGIPLGSNPRERLIDVAVRSQGSTLTIPAQHLDFSGVDGVVHYSDTHGLSASSLTARLFGQPVAADLSSTRQSNGGQFTRVSGTGHADVDALRAWDGMPEFVKRLFAYTEGELDYALALEFPGSASGGARLTLHSDLWGMASALPAPFTKTPEERRQLAIDYLFGGAADGAEDGAERADFLTVRFDDAVSGDLVLDARGLNRGQIYLGELNRAFTVRQVDRNTSALLVSGTLSSFDFDAWNAVAQQLTQGGGQGRTLKESLRLVDVSVGQLQVFDQRFDDINVQVQPSEEGWQIQGRNALLAGKFLLNDSAPWQVTLDYLRLPPPPVRTPQQLRVTDEVDLLGAVDPSKLPAFDFTSAELSLGPNNLGLLSFGYRPTAAGGQIRDLRLDAPQSHVLGMEEGAGASLDWQYQGGVHQSHFSGLVTATNLAQVLPALGHEAFLDSKSARFDATLAWPGSPLGFALKRSSGKIDLRITNGRFMDISSGSSRLLGAFNFDAIVRRVQLDFSDLFGRGFAYDAITAQLVFQDGVIATNDSLIIDGPSSRLRINGAINLPDETIAADMLVRIPLGQNISVLAGLLGAWPIAVSTYLASKIFAEQVGEFTTLAYRLDGPWNNLQAGFDAPTADEENHAGAPLGAARTRNPVPPTRAGARR